MDKKPLKKIRMMDIVRKVSPATKATVRQSADFGGVKEEQVKFSIERKPAAPEGRASLEGRDMHQDAVESVQKAASAQSFGEPKEDMRKSVVVETTPLHATTPPQQAAREEILQEMKEAAIKERAALDLYAEQQREEAAKIKAEEKHEAPRILEAHTEPRPESLPPSAYRQMSEENPDQNKTIPSEREAERPLAMPEMSSLEMDRPIAYIPKEKPTREEKRVLERIEKRERTQKKEAPQGKRRGIFTWIIASVLLGLGAYLVVAVLPRAEIVLMPDMVKWDYMNTIGASTKIADIDASARLIPVAVFSEKKTNAFPFPATGAGKSIERKATGKVTIYNEYNGSSQPLVAGTRLETPDGKLFRLVERVVVPGAKTEAGELVPSSIEADVVADKAGESYNISPVSKFTIPGFAGSAKFDKFYAESKDPMTGGFVGEGKYPTAEDIKAAKENAEKQMKEVIESFLATQVVPEGFKTIESSRRFAIIKETVNEAVDDQGNFSVYIEAEGGVDTLKEEHVLKLMTALAQQVNGEGYEIREHTISYGGITVDAKTGAIALPIDFKGTFWKPIDVEEFKRNAFGKDENELKSFIFGSTSIKKADVSLWPVWVKRVPSDPDRVKVELN